MKQCSWQDKDGLFYIAVKARPNSKTTKIEGQVEIADSPGIPVKKALYVHLAAQPEDNKANKELISILSKTLKVKKEKISIKAGLSSKLKIVVINDHIVL